MIEQKTIFETDGQRFDSVKKAIDYREEKVFRFIKRMLDQQGPAVAPKTYTLATQFILDNRKELWNLICFSSDPEQFED